MFQFYFKNKYNTFCCYIFSILFTISMPENTEIHRHDMFIFSVSLFDNFGLERLRTSGWNFLSSCGDFLQELFLKVGNLELERPHPPVVKCVEMWGDDTNSCCFFKSILSLVYRGPPFTEVDTALEIHSVNSSVIVLYLFFSLWFVIIKSNLQCVPSYFVF